MDDDQQEEIQWYFMESETDNIEKALKFDGDYDLDNCDWCE
jgi:ATP-dependent DNA helicase RecQ